MGPSDVVRLLAPWDGPWWIAGGYAVDLAVGRPVRAHGDIDALVLRRDQGAVRRLLAGWDLWAADPHGRLRSWSPDETLPATVHDIWCRPYDHAPWRLQLMLDESLGELWVSRRDARVRRPVSELGVRSSQGVPFLAPEVQLFYKAKAPRQKDDLDLAEVLPLLGGPQLQWLVGAVETCYGRDSPWLRRLQHAARSRRSDGLTGGPA